MRYEILYCYGDDDEKNLFETDNFDEAVKMIKSFARKYHLISYNRNEIFKYCNMMNIPFDNHVLIGYRANSSIYETLLMIDNA